MTHPAIRPPANDADAFLPDVALFARRAGMPPYRLVRDIISDPGAWHRWTQMGQMPRAVTIARVRAFMALWERDGRDAALASVRRADAVAWSAGPPTMLSAEQARRLFAVIRAAAIAGQPCPTNHQLAVDAGLTVGQTTYLVSRMQRAGWIRVDAAGHKCRRIVITGAPPAAGDAATDGGDSAIGAATGLSLVTGNQPSVVRESAEFVAKQRDAMARLAAEEAAIIAARVAREDEAARRRAAADAADRAARMRRRAGPLRATTGRLGGDGADEERAYAAAVAASLNRRDGTMQGRV